MKNVSFVIVTCKPRQGSLMALIEAFKPYPVFVVNNGADTRLQGANVKSITNKRNLGYGGGANVGIQKALEKGAQWIVFVNDDVIVTKTALTKFLDIVQKSVPAIIGPFAGKIDLKRWTTTLPADKMDYIDGAFTAIHADVFGAVGTFYAPFFIYYEDIDVCIRAQRAGFPQRWFPIPGIHHEGSVTFGRGSFLHQYYTARNHLLFVERQAPVGVKVYECIRLPKTIFEHIHRKEWGALLGVFHYFIRRFGKYRGQIE